MTPHPFVTIYRGDDGWRACWSRVGTPCVIVDSVRFRDLGILTAVGRLAWAVRKSDALRDERLALVAPRS